MTDADPRLVMAMLMDDKWLNAFVARCEEKARDRRIAAHWAEVEKNRRELKPKELKP